MNAFIAINQVFVFFTVAKENTFCINHICLNTSQYVRISTAIAHADSNIFYKNQNNKHFLFFYTKKNKMDCKYVRSWAISNFENFFLLRAVLVHIVTRFFVYFLSFSLVPLHHKLRCPPPRPLSRQNF